MTPMLLFVGRENLFPLIVPSTALAWDKLSSRIESTVRLIRRTAMRTPIKPGIGAMEPGLAGRRLTFP